MISRINFVLTAALISTAVMCWLGYQFGHNDQVETLPYVLHLQNPSLFQNDLFIKNLTAHEPNERSAFVYMLLPFAQNLNVTVLIFHLIFLFALVSALLSISALFVTNKFIQALIVLALLTLGYMTTLGGVEVYYNTFQGGNIASALAAWAIFFFLTKRYKRSAALLAVATPFQILVGLNTFILLGSVMAVEFFLGSRSRQKLKSLLAFAMLYAFTAGIYFLSVIWHKEQARCDMNDETFFKLIFEFRNAHHFLLAYFPLKKSLFFLLLCIAGIIAALRISKTLLKLLVVGGLIVLLYAFVTETTRFVPVASFQFYILTVWLKLFALIAVAVLLSKFLPKIPVRPQTTVFVLSLVGVVMFTGISMNQLKRDGIPYEFTKKALRQNPEIDICMKAKDVADTDALFIHPFEFSALKFFGERSAYVEFKAGLHQRCGVEEWMTRLKEVYGIDASGKAKGFTLKESANNFYENLSEEDWRDLKNKGVTHAILKAGIKVSLPESQPLAANAVYVIWVL